MKTISKIFLTGICFLLAFQLHAQLSVGGKIGVNIATWSISDDLKDETTDEKYVTGLQAGVVLEVPISSILCFQPELLYFQKGFKQTAEEVISGELLTGEKTNTINYLEIPLLLKLKFGPEGGAKFFVTVGPAIGYAASGTTRSKFTYGGFSEDETRDIDFEEDEYSRFDFGASAGIGAAIPAGPGSVNVDARYLFDFINLNSGDGPEEAMNRGIGISVGYIVPIGGE